jgi:hypothetical protein
MFKTILQINCQIQKNDGPRFVWNFCHLFFGFVSHFEIRISNFLAYKLCN